MGRKSVGAVLLLGLASVTLATYPAFSFLTSETRSYPPYGANYGAQRSSISAYAETSPDASSPNRPVTRTQRGIAYIEEPTIIYAKSPLLYPEATVFSDPLPIVPLPQLPAEFLTLKTVQLGSDDKEESKKKSRKGKGKKKEESEEVEADDAQESEGDVEGGYPSSNSRQRQPTRLRERENRNRGGNRAASGGYPGSQESDRVRSAGGNNGAAGGYPSSFEANRQPSRGNNQPSGGYPSSSEPNRAQFGGSSGGYSSPSNNNRAQFGGNDGATGGYSGSSDNNRAQFGGNDGASGGYQGSGISDANRAQSGGNNGASGGYPSSFNANENSDTSGSRRGQGQQSRRNRNRGNDVANEFMRTGDDANDNDNAAEVEDIDDNEEATKGRGKNKVRKTARRLSGRNRGGSRFREENTEDEDDEVAALSKALSDKAQKLGTFYVPTFGNNVLNTIYPAFSQNALLRSLDAQKDEGYPESGKDVSAISISADDDDENASEEKRPRKSKNRSSRRKNRPGRRGENRLRTNDVRAQEPSQEYGAPEGRQNRRPSSEEIPPLGLLPSRRGLRNRNRSRDRDLPEDEILDDEGCDECDEPLDNRAYGAPAQTGYTQPLDSYGPPAKSGYTQPQSSYGAPVKSGYSQPQSGYQPVLTAPVATGYSQPQQSYGAPVTSGFTQSQSSYGAPVQYSPPQQSQPAYGVPQKSQPLASYEVPASSGYSQPQSSYGTPATMDYPTQPLQSYGTPSITSAKFVEPRQLSQTTTIDGSSSSGGVVDQELIKTVQAILSKYPN